MKKLLVILIAFAFSPLAYADGAETPGSIWNSLETSPIQQESLLDYFHIDQGIVVGHLQEWKVIPYVALNATKSWPNTYQWNNKLEVEGGVKLSRKFTNGGLDVSAALANERRLTYIDQNKNNLVVSVDGWYSWTKFKDTQTHQTPGNISFIYGNLSPLEQNNLIGQVRLEQGLTLVTVKTATVDALYWGQVGFDSDSYSWNNRAINGLGVRASLPFTGGIASLTGGVECVNPSWKGDAQSGCGPMIKLDLYAGWNKIGSSK